MIGLLIAIEVAPVGALEQLVSAQVLTLCTDHWLIPVADAGRRASTHEDVALFASDTFPKTLTTHRTLRTIGTTVCVLGGSPDRRPVRQIGRAALRTRENFQRHVGNAAIAQFGS